MEFSERERFWLRPTYAFFSRQELLLVAVYSHGHCIPPNSDGPSSCFDLGTSSGLFPSESFWLPPPSEVSPAIIEMYTGSFLLTL
jgi:hypothetical protein